MKRNVSMHAFPVLTRDLKALPSGSETSDDSVYAASDCFTNSSLVSSASSASLNSTASRCYPASANERKTRSTPPPASGTPEWYIKKIHEQNVSSKQLSALQAALQGKDVGWIKHFVELGGMSVLARWLYHTNRQSSDFTIEFEVVKCLTYILNHRSATVSALAQGASETVIHITSGLDTLHLPTRRLLLDILVFLVYWDDGANYQDVIKGLEALSEDNDEPCNAYAFWFKSLRTILAGRGKMGSRVGASEDFKRNGGETDGLLTEYLMSNILLMNGIMQAIDDLDVRLHHRSQMESCGLQTIVKLVHDCGFVVVDKQLELFKQTLEEDEHSLEERMHQISACDLGSMNDVYNALRAKMKGSEKAEACVLSILQHLLLLRPDGSELVHHLQLIDSVVADVVMDKKLGGAEKRLGVSVERIVGQLDQVERAQVVEQELINVRSTALHLKVEKEAMEDRITHMDKHVANLQAQVLQLAHENKQLVKSARTEPTTETEKIATNTPYQDRIAQLAEAIPGSPMPLTYLPTSTPQVRQHTPICKAQLASHQPFWGLSSWFGLGDNGAASPPLISQSGLGITGIKDEVRCLENNTEKF